MMHGREKSDPPVGRPAWPVRWTLLSKEFVALRTRPRQRAPGASNWAWACIGLFRCRPAHGSKLTKCKEFVTEAAS